MRLLSTYYPHHRLGCPSYVWTSQVNPNMPVYILSQSNEVVEFPSYLAAVALKIYNLQHSLYSGAVPGSLMNPIRLNSLYKKEELESFRDYVQTLSLAARTIYGTPVRHIKNVYGIAPFSPDQKHLITLIVNPLVRDHIQDVLPPDTPEGNEKLGKMLEMAKNAFGIPSLASAFARELVESIWPEFQDMLSKNRWDTLPWEEKQKVLTVVSRYTPLTIPVIEEIKLKYYHAEEMSVADWIGMNGQPSHIPVEKPWSKIDLSTKRITNLVGLNLIMNGENVVLLDLQFNPLYSISPGAFSWLRNLQSVLLRGNNIHTLSDFTFDGIPHLRQLDLSANQITSIQPLAFQGLGSLEVLSLVNNYLRSIPQDAFLPLKKLETLYLAHNLLPGTADEFKQTHSLPDTTAIDFEPQSSKKEVLS